MGLGLETTDSSDPLGLDPWSTSVPSDIPLDPYGGGHLGGMASSALGNITSPDIGMPVIPEPNMPYNCKYIRCRRQIEYLHYKGLLDNVLKCLNTDKNFPNVYRTFYDRNLKTITLVASPS